MLNLQRRIVPVCLTFSLLHFALPALADTPAKPTAQASTAQTVVLQHVVPGDLVKMMHWELASNLPTGVMQIVAVPLQNALLVTATPAGLAQVRQIVKSVDVEPRQVEVKFTLAYASDADLKVASLGSNQYAVGLPAARFLQMLTEQKAVSASTIITTANYVNASTNLFYGSTTPLTFGVTPRVNFDHSLSLVLDAAVPGSVIKHEAHTVQSGDTLVIVKPSSGFSATKKSMVLFVTPTVK